MPVNCGGCGKFVSTTGSVVCTRCPLKYHDACVNMPPGTTPRAGWQCPECKRNEPRDNEVGTPVKGISEDYRMAVPGLAGATEDIKLFRSELQAVREALNTFRQEMTDLMSSVKACTTRLDALDDRVDTIEKKVDACNPQNVTLLQETVYRLQEELNDCDQAGLANDVEITCIPEGEGESLGHVVTLVAAKLGVTLEARDIVSVGRAGRRRAPAATAAGAARLSPRTPRPIIVRLARRVLRDDLLKNARVRRGATTADLDLPAHTPHAFYINERLTKTNRSLFGKARVAGKTSKWRFVWTKEGRILAKQNEGDSQVHQIKCDADIQRIFGVAVPDTQTP